MELSKAYELIKEKVISFQKSDEYLNFIKFVSGFHNYSWSNRLLIWAQMPEATLVSGFKAWNKKGRHIKKGEKGITIFAPCTKKVEKTNELGEKEVKTVCTGKFFTTTVFDVSQTDGKEIPEMNIPTLKGKVKNFNKMIKGIKNALPKGFSFTIDDKEDCKEKGYCNNYSKEIVVHQNPEEQMFKTAVHEAGHSLMEHDTRQISREQKECEAESVAFIVCNHFGYDTSDYSVKYIAGWKGDKDFIEESLNYITKTADKIINSIEQVLA